MTRILTVRFEPLKMRAVRDLPNRPVAIEMVYEMHERSNLVDRRGRLLVERFNGQKNLDFEVFFAEQAPAYPIPPPPVFGHVKFKACPEANLTNQQCFDRHGIAVSGYVAPCIEKGDDGDCSVARARAVELGIRGLVIE